MFFTLHLSLMYFILLLSHSILSSPSPVATIAERKPAAIDFHLFSSCVVPQSMLNVSKSTRFDLDLQILATVIFCFVNFFAPVDQI